MNQYIRDFADPSIESININDDSDFYKILQKQDSNKNFSVFHGNIRSISKNFNAMLVLLHKLKYDFDVIVFTETWEIIDQSFFEIDGFKMLYNGGNINKNDGVVVYIKDIYKNFSWEIIECGNIKLIETKLCIENKKVVITSMYRPPSISVYDFNENFSNYLNNSNHYSKDLHFFVGDINIDIASEEDFSQEYLNILGELGFQSLINSSTRIQGNSKSTIDHIFIKNKNNFASKSYIIKTDITDHFQIAAQVDIEVPQECEPETKTYNKLNEKQFLHILQNETWDELYNSNDVNIAANTFIIKFKDAINFATKKIKLNNKCRKRNPWITQGLMRSAAVKQSLYKKSLSNLGDVNIQNSYKKYRNKLSELIKTAKQNYYKNEIEKNKFCNKTLWKTINSYTNKKTTTSSIKKIKYEDNIIEDQKMIANKFNTYYSEVGKEMAKKIVKPSTSVLKKRMFHKSIFFNPTSETEVANLINELKPKKAPGKDEITAELLKLAIYHVKKPLTYIINKILQSGKFPDAFKEAVVKPLFKKGDVLEMGNYRPISLISNLAKVTEKVIKQRINSYLTKHQLLSHKQFGFRQGISTEDAIVNLTNNIYQGLDKGDAVLCVFVDLAKAFDTVSHKKLIEIVEDLGFRGTALDLIKDYLRNRVQYVRIENHLSNPSIVEFGVPQGTVLGPILFSMYINGLLSLKTQSDIASFADDTVLVYKAKTWSEVKEIAEQDLKIIKAWFDEMVLSINFSKTKYLPFSCNKTKLPTFNSLKIYTEQKELIIDSVDHIKYLGIEIDKHLKWNIHAEFLIKKLRFILFKFKQFKHILNADQIKIIYYSLVQSHLQYGIAGWGGLYKNNLKNIEVIQKLFLKIMTSKNKCYPSDLLYKESGVLDIRQIYAFRIVCLQHKSKQQLKLIDHDHDTRYKKEKQIQTSKTDKTIGQRAYYFIAPRIYSNLPQEIRDILNPHLFNKYAKNWIKTSNRHVIHDLIDLKNC